MVEKAPSMVYLTNPPQWDSVMWCSCGYAENLGRVYGKTADQYLQEKWERANKNGITIK